ncbi:glycosyltransferase family 2 protein [Candidatus Uhrbacteria bacterium]|nr:glycosyltransferase family 2 protein [Candidatus Uhrbacteria bacterium]
MSRPSVSVIIPTYQHARTIARCLDSVLAQTLPADEVIVVNDGSTDGVHAALHPYDGRIVLIDQENQGSNPARNRGFAASRGDRVVFCDADVIMRPDMLERLSAALDADAKAGYAYCGFRFGWKRFPSFAFDGSLLKRMNYIHTTAMIRREAFPGFDVAIRRFQDWDLWLTMLARGWHGTFVGEELFRVMIASKSRIGSQWRPSALYQVPWNLLRWRPLSVEKYEAARAVIARKHGLPAAAEPLSVPRVL